MVGNRTCPAHPGLMATVIRAAACIRGVSSHTLALVLIVCALAVSCLLIMVVVYVEGFFLIRGRTFFIDRRLASESEGLAEQIFLDF